MTQKMQLETITSFYHICCQIYLAEVVFFYSFPSETMLFKNTYDAVECMQLITYFSVLCCYSVTIKCQALILKLSFINFYDSRLHRKKTKKSSPKVFESVKLDKR